jgi:hypothetical protein
MANVDCLNNISAYRIDSSTTSDEDFFMAWIVMVEILSCAFKGGGMRSGFMRGNVVFFLKLHRRMSTTDKVIKANIVEVVL